MDGQNKGGTERRERGTKGRQQNARRRWVEGGGERATSRASTTAGATALALHNGRGRSIARRLTEERWRKRGEESVERTTEGQGDGEQTSAWSLRERDITMEKRRG